MARVRGRDSQVVGGILDHSIRGPPSLPYHLYFIVGLAEGDPPTTSISFPLIYVLIAPEKISV
jgi:hypothetical protein